jgi:hypothetical protein
MPAAGSYYFDMTLTDVEIEYDVDEEGIFIHRALYNKPIYIKGKFDRYEPHDVTKLLDAQTREEIEQRIQEHNSNDHL